MHEKTCCPVSVSEMPLMGIFQPVIANDDDNARLRDWL